MRLIKIAITGANTVYSLRTLLLLGLTLFQFDTLTTWRNTDNRGLVETANVFSTNPLRIKPFNFSVQKKVINYLGLYLKGVNPVQMGCKMIVRE